MKTLPSGPSTTTRIPDYMTHSNAMQLAAKIIGYWRQRGARPHVWVEPLGGGLEKDAFVVRSDMAGGWPRG